MTPPPRQTNEGLPGIAFKLPDGVIRLTIEAGEERLRLSQFLSRRGHGLNTRCGGKNLCHGCRIIPPQSTKPVAACQLLVKNALAYPLEGTWRIPASSLACASIEAEAGFEVRIPFSPAKQATGKKHLGMAIDVGTTTVAVLLTDLVTGVILARAAGGNKQARFGDNVMTRIEAAVADPIQIEAMRQAVVEETLTPLMEEACQQADLTDEAPLERLTLAGNPTMLHLLLGEDVKGLAQWPFKPVFLGAREVTLPLPRVSAQTVMTLLPGLGPFVGADLTAGLLATGMLYDLRNALLVDIGTNGEIVARIGGGFFAAATAAGPAFEGGRLSCGIHATEGAVSHLRIDPASRLFELEVIGREKVIEAGENRSIPLRGLCGTAYLDFLAEAHEHGLLGENGRFLPAAYAWPGYLEDECDRALRLDPEGNPELLIREADLAELLQAKAAIAAGIIALLQEKGREACEVDFVFVAGGFGQHLNLDHALAIGLFPGFKREQLHTVGNTSLGGAWLCLLDPALLEETKAAADTAETVELNQLESFEDHYIDCLQIGVEED